MRSIHHQFEWQMRRKPEAVALVCEDERISYGELNRRADLLAGRLKAMGVGGDVLVAVQLERSIDLIVALLGILKAGSAYVGLDLNAPAKRLQTILKEASPAVLITRPGAAPVTDASCRTLELDNAGRWMAESQSGQDDSDETATDGRLAYVSFTSGSTGKPKGVCVPHRGVLRLARDEQYLSVGPDEVFLHLSPASFDASTFEIWSCLLNGATLVIYPPTPPTLSGLERVIVTHGVTTLWLTAGLFHLVVDDHVGALRPVRRLIAGGDVLSVRHVRKLLTELPHLEFLNGYGPTENTTFTCCHRVTSLPPEDRPLPIGRPIRGTEVYVVDTQLKRAPVGEAGELLVGGEGLALGYLNQPELTAEKFIAHPFADEPGARLYRTGDRVRFLPDGTLEFLGRLDRQVKIGGYRVEPAEIEAALRRHPRVGDAAVIARRNGLTCRLSAFVSPASNGDPHEPVAGDDVREFVRATLPPYMVPADVTVLQALPLNPQGKVDREALEALPADSPAFHGPAAQTSTEQSLSLICRQTLDGREVNPATDLWNLGLDSLQVMRLLLHVERVFGRSLTAETLLRARTVRRLAEVLDGTTSERSGDVVPLQPLGWRAPLFCVHMTGGDLTRYAPLVSHLGSDRPAYGLAPPPLTAEERERGCTTLESLAAHHVRSIKSVRPSGPYHLCGYCFGGLLAFEIARQLLEDGERVGMLGVFDFPMNLGDDFRLRLDPRSLVALARNVSYFFADFFSLSPARRRSIMSRMAGNALNRLRGVREVDAAFIEHTRAEAEASVPDAQTWVAHERAWRRYQVRSYAGVVTLFRARRLPLLLPYDPTLGWSRLTLGGLNIRIAPGPGLHGEMLKPPYAKALARQLEVEMEAAESLASVRAGLINRAQSSRLEDPLDETVPFPGCA